MFALAALCGMMRPFVFDDLGNFVFDTWQRLKPRAFERDGPVRIIAIDEASLAELGQWPWPRTRLAEATHRLVELGAAAIAFDIIFNEPDRTSAESIVAARGFVITAHWRRDKRPSLCQSAGGHAVRT
jgi:adenylate cyclase